MAVKVLQLYLTKQNLLKVQDLSSLSNLVDNLAEGICKFKCIDCDWFCEYKTVKDENIIKYKLPSCNENYSSNIKIATQKHI